MAMVDPSASAALQALGAARTPGDGAAERAWVLMQQRIVEGPPPLELEAPAVARTAAMARGLAVAALVAVAAALVLSWGRGWFGGVATATPDAAPYTTVPEAPRADAPTPAPRAEGDASAASDPADDAPTPALVEPEPANAPAKPRTRPARPAKSIEPTTTPATPPSPAKTTSLAAEMKLLARASAAMRSGDHTTALAVLDEHARAHPGGQLAPERDYKRAVALCALGRTEQARTAAAAFARAHPGSPLRAKAEDVCRG